MAGSHNSNDGDDLGAAFAVAGLAAVAAGISALFKDSGKSNEQTRLIQQQAEIQNVYNYAVSCIQQGDFNQATQLFFQILQRDPNHAPTYNFIAWIYAIHNYRLDQALAFANRAAELASSPLEKAFYLDTIAEVYAHGGEFDKAATLSIEFLKVMGSFNQAPSSPVTYFRLAWYYQLNQDFNGVSLRLQQASQTGTWGSGEYTMAGDIYHAVASTYFSKSSYCEAINQYDNATNQYQTAIQLAVNNRIPDDVFCFKLSICLNDEGVVLYHQGNYEHSKLLHEKAYEIYPANPYPIINLAQLAAKDGNKALMRQWLEIGIPLIEDSPPLIHKDRLISIMLNELDFEAYQDNILDLLFSNGKLHVYDYKRFLESRACRKVKENRPANFSQQNFYSPVSGVAGNVEGNFIYRPQYPI